MHFSKWLCLILETETELNTKLKLDNMEEIYVGWNVGELKTQKVV